MIKIDGIEVSEDTIRNALKKAGISLKKKHEWKPGDVGLYHNCTSEPRLITMLNGDYRSYDKVGDCQSGVVRLNYFANNYKYIGRFDEIVKEYLENHPELEG